MKPESPPSLFLSSCDRQTGAVVPILEQELQRPSAGARKSALLYRSFRMKR
jgi:hypothetical protein